MEEKKNDASVSGGLTSAEVESWNDFFTRSVEIIKSSASTTLLLFMFIYFLLFQYCRLNFYRDPGSRFYNETRAFEVGYSEYRSAQAHSFIEAANTSESWDSPKAGRNPSVCAALVTIRRDSQNFLEVDSQLP